MRINKVFSPKRMTVNSDIIEKRSVHNENDEICPREGNRFTYNICHDPSHPDTVFTEINSDCHISRMFAQVMKEVTRHEKYRIEGLMHEYENSNIRCENTVRRLGQQSLNDIININFDHIDSENVYTSTYLKIARLTYLFQQINCTMSSAIDECCLQFPSYIFQRMKSRILNKWFIVQDRCGDFIDHSHCDASTEIIIDSPVKCEDARDIIYLLLKHARDILLNSIQVIDHAVTDHS